MIYNWPVIGHTAQLQALENDILKGNIASGYLLAGPDSIGKYLIAHTMAAILQCPENFCRKCPVCRQIELGHHYDTIEMRDDGSSVKIEQIRQLISTLSLSIQAKYKIVLIQNIERMTLDAANCLLKTLEEPNERTIFFLTTNNLREVLTTIISRVRLCTFQSMSEKNLTEALLNWFPEGDKARVALAASFSMGLPARAVSLLKNPELFETYSRMYDVLSQFMQRSSIYQRFSYVDELQKKPEEVGIFLDILLHLIRKKCIDESFSSEIRGKNQYNLALLRKIEEAKRLLKLNSNVKLTLENLMLSL